MKLAALFKDHMVLQRDRPLPVWGWAAADQAVGVTLGDATATAVAVGDGRWQVILPPCPAGGPLELAVVAGDQRIVLRDVWVGEVWLASGQSNMSMSVDACADAKREIARAVYPGIRMFTTERVALTTRQETVGGAWKVCDPGTVIPFSAAAYFFARELHQSLGVAVGMIDSSWGGTPAEAWTSRQGLQGEPGLRHYIEQLDRFLGPEGAAARAAARQAADTWQDTLPKDPGNAGEANGWQRPDAPETDWKTMILPIGWQAAGHDISGVFWFRRTVDLPADWAGRDLELHIGACDKRDATYFNGRFLGGMGMEDGPDAWCTPRVYAVPGHQVRAGRQVIAVRVFSDIYQGGMIGPETEMWLAPAGAPAPARIQLAGAWRYRIEHDFGKVNPAPPPTSYGDNNPNTPGILFDSMIAPHVPYALRGFIWYQGESNAGRATEYRSLFPSLIRDWRRVFGQGDLPFYFVQLANFMAVHDRPTESAWAELREAQRRTLDAVPLTGMAVAIDIGEIADIHPKNKQDIGRRLAACALAADYGLPDRLGASPRLHAAWQRKTEVVVRFADTGSGLGSRDGGPAVTGFAIAGGDRVFHWASARIDAADTVVLACPAVTKPCWLRYAWADNPDCNLLGGSRLPAAPFETALPAGEWLREPYTPSRH